MSSAGGKARRDRASGPYGELDLDQASDPAPSLEGAWQPGDSDIHALTVPPGEYPNQNLPGSIEEAVLTALDQVPAPPDDPAAKPSQAPSVRESQPVPSDPARRREQAGK